MTRTRTFTERPAGRCRPRLERLESRIALAVSIGTSVQDVVNVGAGLSSTGQIAMSTFPAIVNLSSPTVLSVQFSNTIDPFSLRQLDVEIQEQQNGSWMNVFNVSNAPAESLDSTSTQLNLTLTQPLAPGDYRVVLPPTSSLLWLGTESSIASSHDQVLGTFSVVQPGVTIGNALVLGTVGSATLSASGSLDLANNPGAVALYQFTLPSGHHWKIGAEVFANQIGSALLSNLTLFDAQGQPISSANLGDANDPTDPYLFAGLEPGTYYLGVSGAGNVPRTSNGYNLALGTPASNLPGQTGGAFRLDLVAAPADAPTQVLGFSLQYADPLDPHPTGFALAFSSAIDVSTLVGSPSPGVELVNQAGDVFPVTLVAQHATLAQYYFVANEDLPAGQYSVVAATANGGLTDLTGSAPVASGLPSGVLATFQVSGSLDVNPYDLGPLYGQVFNGVNGQVTIAPGASVTYRFVTTFEGRYKLTGSYSGGSLTYQTLGSNGVVGVPVESQSGQFAERFADLTPGVYFIQFRNVGTTPTSLNWALRNPTAPGSFESLLSNGVGQESALNALSITGSALGLDGSGSTGSSVSTQPAPGAATALLSNTPSALASHGLAPSGLVFTLGNTLVGRPTTDADHIAAVGPTSGSGAFALASSTTGVPQGLGYAKAPAISSSDGAPVASSSPAPAGRPSTDPEPVNGALVAAALPSPGSDSNASAIAAADWFSNLGKFANRLMTLAPLESPPDEISPDTSKAVITLARDDAPVATTEEGTVEQTNLEASLAIVTATALSFHYQAPFKRWLKRSRTPAESRRFSPLRLNGRSPLARF